MARCGAKSAGQWSSAAVGAAAVALVACGAQDLQLAEHLEDEVSVEGHELAFPGRSADVTSAVLVIDGQAHTAELDLVDGERVFEGDILIDEGLLVSAGGGDYELGTYAQELAATTSSRLWPSGVVHYTIDPALPKQERVTAAIAHWEANTSLRFVKRTSQTAYVTFRRSTGCSSSVGRTGKQQFINLADNCSTGSTIHEIGHAVGLWHEQSRSDRDRNAKVLWANIRTGKEHNFRTYVERGYAGQDVGSYDFGSIMHYSSYAFSRNGKPTLTRLDGSTFTANRKGLSATDLSGVAKLYGGTSSTTPNSFVVDTNKANNNATYAKVEVSSNWSSSNSVSGYYGTGYRYASAAKVSDGTTFWFYLPASASKTIDAWWTSSSNRNSQTPFVVFNAQGQKLSTVYRDQRQNGGKWNVLGTYAFTAGWNRVVVSRWSSSSGYVIADAVRIR